MFAFLLAVTPPDPAGPVPVHRGPLTYVVLAFCGLILVVTAGLVINAALGAVRRDRREG